MNFKKVKRYAALFLASAVMASCAVSGNKNSEVEFSPIMKKALEDKTSRYYADFENFSFSPKAIFVWLVCFYSDSSMCLLLLPWL